MKDICGTTGLACIRCNPGACEHRHYNAVQKMAAKINKEANDLIFGTVRTIVTEAGITHEHEINEKFVIMAITKQMPQRPYEEADGYCPDGNEIWGYYCPNCDHDFEDHQPPYCPVCGQKIDWSPKDEEEDDGEDD